MLKIGVTGGIGSGKSTVCNIFRNLGVPIFTSDVAGREILNQSAEVKEEVCKNFGKDMYDSEGQLDSARLAKLVFSDPIALDKLNSIVHPRVQNKFEEWQKYHESKSYVIKEAAILFETGLYHDLDKVITVFAPKEVRLERVMRRDGVIKEEVMKRMRFQYTDEERNRLADYIIINEEESDLLTQVMELNEIFLNELKN